LTTLTFAPAMTAPDVSVTVPTMVAAPVVWDQAADESDASSARIPIHFMSVPPEETPAVAFKNGLRRLWKHNKVHGEVQGLI
jgi:hypothetical protein